MEFQLCWWIDIDVTAEAAIIFTCAQTQNMTTCPGIRVIERSGSKVSKPFVSFAFV